MSQWSNMRGAVSLAAISLIISLLTLAAIIYLVVLTTSSAKNRDYRVEKSLAGELSDNNLPLAAIEEYRKILNDRNLDPTIKGNICYLIGQLYFEKLADYENAAAYFIRARNLHPEGSFYDEAGRNLVASLERMGRLASAKRELDRTVNLDSAVAVKPGEIVVARIGETPIYLSELENEIQSLPAQAQSEFLSRQGKLNMLNQLVGLELMYRAALREKFDRDPRLLKRKENLEKQLLTEKYVTERILPQVNLDTLDIRNFYLANRKERYGDKAYEEVRSRVLLDYQQEKSQKALNELIEKLAELEKVQIFEENIR